MVYLRDECDEENNKNGMKQEVEDDEKEKERDRKN